MSKDKITLGLPDQTRCETLLPIDFDLIDRLAQKAGVCGHTSATSEHRPTKDDKATA